MIRLTWFLFALAAIVWSYVFVVVAHACDHDIGPASDSAHVWIEGSHVIGGGSADVYLSPVDSAAGLTVDTLRIMVRHSLPVFSSWIVVYSSAALDTAWQSIRPMPSQPLLWWKPNCCSPWVADPASQLLDSGIARAAVVFTYGSDGRTGTLELGRIVVHNHSASVGSRIWIALDNPGRARQAGTLKANGQPNQVTFDCPSEVQLTGSVVRLYRGGQ